MNSREEKRWERMNIIRRSMKKAGKNLNEEKLIAMCLCEFGCARRTAMEYIKAIKIYYG